MLQAIKSWFVSTGPELIVRNIHPENYDTVIIAHASCPDGTASAWFLLRIYPTAYVHFVQERDFNKDTRMPQLAGRHVILADWCYPVNILRRLSVIVSKLTIYDHHDTAREWCEEAKRLGAEVHFDVAKCGAELCADAANYHPWFLVHEKGIRLGTLDEFHNSTPEDVYAFGRTILAHEKWALDRVARTAQRCIIESIPAIVVQSPTWGSELGNELLECSDAHVAIVVRYCFRTNRHFVSLRSRPESGHNHVNVARICEKYDGGGHPCAAGFSAPDLSMITYVK
jgi:hypothetical protein